MSAPSPDVKSLFIDALQLGSPEEVETFLERACPGDTSARLRVRALLKAHWGAGRFPVPTLRRRSPGRCTKENASALSASFA
jgi:hypothetical protein